jgi:integrase
LTRAALHPVAARNELEALKAALRYAAGRGSQFPLALLAIEPVRFDRGRRGTALTLDELDYFCRYAAAHLRHTFHLLGTIGLRVSEALALRDEHVDLHGLALRIPPALCKERRPKTIPLFSDEAWLLAEQLAARAPAAETVFPRKGGTPWRREHFYYQAVVPTRKRAAVAWRRDHGLDDKASTPFEWLATDDHGDVVLNEDDTEKIGESRPMTSAGQRRR